jgi:hypothetical protein
MIDDYQYQPQQLPPKNEGLFGYGGKPNEGSRGFQGSIVDYGGTGGGGVGGGQEGPQGPQGPQGPPGTLVNGVQGDMLYHNGTGWVAFSKTGKESILSMTSSGVPFWITADYNNSILYYSATLGWFPLLPPSGPETYVLGFKNNALEWMQTTDCGATGP